MHKLKAKRRLALQQRFDRVLEQLPYPGSPYPDPKIAAIYRLEWTRKPIKAANQDAVVPDARSACTDPWDDAHLDSESLQFTRCLALRELVARNQRYLSATFTPSLGQSETRAANVTRPTVEEEKGILAGPFRRQTQPIRKGRDKVMISHYSTAEAAPAGLYVAS